ncbi:MFS transporter [Metarhizium robertsii]|uniref:Major facilitator superfamily domain protein n=2 Tax=Metarhizium robertsii TaxID=568076 RepID=E9ENT9_METRA|nr:Major facilitator superfamily domain protein [Metarhizium robertsii ARSEF 23]EFZ02209.1 Major facilitator superfamily domain protein [Metarhizium robertsii ARSEF 23]EXV05381.1 MFS transporter [Metarhizium robertsii]
MVLTGPTETNNTDVGQDEHGREIEGHPLGQIQSLNEQDAQDQYAIEAMDYGDGILSGIRSRTRSHTDHIIISWEVDDPDNPHNWSTSRKTFVVLVCVMLVLNSTLSSALPSMAIPNITADYGISDATENVLPISVFLIGYIFGPLIWGPLTEHYGRRNLTVVTFVVFTLFTMACGLAPSWGSFLVFRMICGACAGAPIAIVAGILADVFGDHRTRGRAYAVFMVATLWGPLFSPIISGYTSMTIGWRWAFWIDLMFAGFTLLIIAWLPETFGPILLARRAQRMRKQDPAQRVIAPRELEETSLSQLLTVVITRPIRMLASELIVTATCAYLALVYAIFYMSFQAFPIIFHDLYGLNPGETGLTYLLIGAGGMVSLPVFWYWDVALVKAQVRGSWWSKREESRRLPLACMGGPLFVISLFWLGFSAKISIPFVVPMLAGIPFGMGYMLIFMALLNYLTDSYEIFAASANAAASCCRSILAVVLPLATTHMFRELGIAGACSLIGGLSAVMCVIPFIFIWKGPSIRARSKFCIALREQKEEMQRRADAQRARLERMRAGKERRQSVKEGNKTEEV